MHTESISNGEFQYHRTVISSLGSKIASSLTRKTSGRALIPEIDGLRSIAILSVVLFHSAENFLHYTDSVVQDSWLDRLLVRMLSTGEYGVPLFFVISGFILALPFASHYMLGETKPKLSKYFMRRLTRLEPPYIFCLLVLAAKELVQTNAFSNPAQITETGKHLLASLFYVHTPIYGQQGAISPVAWSLEVEVQFYILAPFLCTIFAWPRLVRRAFLVVAAIGFSWFFGIEKPILGPYLVNQMAFFLVGLLLADVYLTYLRDAERSKFSLAWDLLAAGALAGVFVFKAYGLAPVMLTPWLIFVGYLAVFRAWMVRRFFSALPIVILGGMCYSIYLWHFLIVAGYRMVHFKLFSPGANWHDRVFYILAATAIAVAFSAVMFALIERPTMDPKWPKKLARLLRISRTTDRSGSA